MSTFVQNHQRCQILDLINYSSPPLSQIPAANCNTNLWPTDFSSRYPSTNVPIPAYHGVQSSENTHTFFGQDILASNHAHHEPTDLGNWGDRLHHYPSPPPITFGNDNPTAQHHPSSTTATPTFSNMTNNPPYVPTGSGPHDRVPTQLSSGEPAPSLRPLQPRPTSTFPALSPEQRFNAYGNRP